MAKVFRKKNSCFLLPGNLGFHLDDHPILQETEILVTEISMVARHSYDTDVDCTPFATQPEKVLYYEVLKRACWDLRPEVSESIRSCAISWFSAGFRRVRESGVPICFLDCVEVLELGSNEIAYLKQAVHAAKEKLNKSQESQTRTPEQEKREPSGARACALSSSEWLSKRSSYSAVCRIFRDL